MLFNIEKCKVMHLRYNNSKPDYVMDGSVLQSVIEEKDLGVTIQYNTIQFIEYQQQTCME